MLVGSGDGGSGDGRSGDGRSGDGWIRCWLVQGMVDQVMVGSGVGCFR